MTQQAASGVSEKTTQGAEVRRRGQWWWAEASIWTERMVSALGNGVKGGKWYSLMDKVVRPTTLGAEATDKATGGQLAWLRSECRDGKAE